MALLVLRKLDLADHPVYYLVQGAFVVFSAMLAIPNGFQVMFGHSDNSLLNLMGSVSVNIFWQWVALSGNSDKSGIGLNSLLWF